MFWWESCALSMKEQKWNLMRVIEWQCHEDSPHYGKVEKPICLLKRMYVVYSLLKSIVCYFLQSSPPSFFVPIGIAAWKKKNTVRRSGEKLTLPRTDSIPSNCPEGHGLHLVTPRLGVLELLLVTHVFSSLVPRFCRKLKKFEDFWISDRSFTWLTGHETILYDLICPLTPLSLISWLFSFAQSFRTL